MPKTGGHDQSARASQPVNAPLVEPPRLHTHELNALVDDALAPDPVPGSAGTGAEEAATDAVSTEEAGTDETMPASDPAPAELEIVGEADDPPPPPAPRVDPYLGLLIDRRYEIQKLIAQGGMGLVYRCRHSVLGKKLAIKIIRADVAQMPDGYERFLIEAKAASAIGNEHIVDISDFGALPDGSSYLVMEYLTGVPLSTLMKRHGRMDVPRLAEIGCQIAEGLGAAHAAGIVHRDLKPDNVFVIERKGQDFVKILDFGVARMEQSAKKLTQAGTIVGTPHYMSPEQATGKDVDHRGDIYALGVILYELCAGQVPFDGSHYVAVLHQHLQDAPPPLASLDPPVLVPEELERIVDKCLAKSPGERYATMAELAQDLAVFSTRSRGRASTGVELPALPAAGDSPGGPGTLALPEHGFAATSGDAVSTLVSTSSTAPPSGPLRFPVPTAALPAPSPTLVLPRPSGSFTLEQKRRLSKISLAVLLVTIAWAAWTLGTSSDPAAPAADPVTAQPGPRQPSSEPEPQRAPTGVEVNPGAANATPATAAGGAEPSGIAPSGNVSSGGAPNVGEANADGPSAGGSGQGGAVSGRPSAEPPTPATSRRAEARAKRARRGTSKGTPPDARREGERASGANKGRSKEFMNPWPAPR
jgi:serine/threonine protein kinase